MTNDKLKLSFFNNRRDTTPKVGDVCPESFLRRVNREEKDGFMYCPAIWQDEATRGKAGINYVTGVCLDYDKAGGDLDATLQRLDGIECVFHTTHSHKPDAPKFRIILPLAEPSSVESWPLVHRGAVALAGQEGLDSTCNQPERAYYWPSCPSEYAEYARTEHKPGRRLTVAELLEVAARNEPETTKQMRSENGSIFRGVNEGGRNDALTKVAGSFIAKGMGYEEALQSCRDWNQSNTPPLEDSELKRTFRSIYERHQRKIPTEAEWSESIALPILPPVMKLDPELVPGAFRSWLCDIADRLQVPLDFPAVAALVAVGSVIGTGCSIMPKRHDSWSETPNVWGAVIGRPSLKKTPAIKEAHRPLQTLISEANFQYDSALVDYLAQKQAAKLKLEAEKTAVKKTLDKKAKSGEDVNLDDFIEKISELNISEPIHRRFSTQDSTIEKIAEILQGNPRGIMVNRDELIGWLKALDKAGREGDRAFYLEAWGGMHNYTHDRIGRGTICVPYLYVSVFGAITPGPLADYVYQARQGGVGSDGLLQRFQLMVYPDDPAGWANIDRKPNNSALQQVTTIFQRLATDDFLAAVATEKTTDGRPALRLSPEAQVIFDGWLLNLENKLLSRECQCAALESHFAKYRKLMPALALIFHLVEQAANPPVSVVSVSVEAVNSAIGWCTYLESHARRIYAPAERSDIVAAKEILKHIQNGQIKEGDSIRDIYRKQWNRLTTPEVVTAGLAILEDFGWLRVEAPADGKRAKTIRLNPQLRIS